jgi:ADP-heptose:LPS heptosyltransferase
MKIVLFHKGGIGDIVFGVPLIRDVRKAYPRAEITVLTHQKGQEVLGFCHHLNEILALSSSESEWSLNDANKMLTHRRFDIAISTALSFRAAYSLWRLRARVRVGFLRFPQQVFFTHGAQTRPFEVVFARRYQRLAEALGIPIGDAIPRLTIPNACLESARARLERMEFPLSINRAARRRWLADQEMAGRKYCRIRPCRE